MARNDIVNSDGSINWDEVGKVSEKSQQSDLDILNNLMNNQVWQYQTDTKNAYSKNAPDRSQTVKITSISGQTITWNQLLQSTQASTTINGVTFTNNGDGSITVNGTTTTTGTTYYFSHVEPTTINNEVVMWLTDDTTNNTLSFGLFDSNYHSFGVNTFTNGFYTMSSTPAHAFLYIQNSGVTFNNYKVTPQIFDVTKIFGKGNEPLLISDFRSLYPSTYYAYNAGALIHATVNTITSSGGGSYQIPSTILGYVGYGQSYTDTTQTPNVTYVNVLDFDKKTFHSYGSYDNTGAWVANEVTTDVSSLIKNPVILNILEGQTLTFDNSNGTGYGIPIPNSVDFQTSLDISGGLFDFISNENTLLFYDDFRGTSLDLTKWSYQNSSNTGELQVYNDSSVIVEDGLLKIHAHRTVPGDNTQWTSGRIHTINNFEFGSNVRVEVRAKFPCVKGSFPAIWAYGSKYVLHPQGVDSNGNVIPKNWPYCGEIDIIEQMDRNKIMQSTFHYYSGGSTNTTPKKVPVTVDEWHTYWFENDGVNMTIGYDNNTVVTFPVSTFTVQGFNPFTGTECGQRIVLNMAVGGSATAPDNTTPDDFYMLVDYVKVTSLTKRHLPKFLTVQKVPTNLTVGSTQPIVCDVDQFAQNKTVYFYSTDETVATIDELGTLTGVGAGTCTIYCMTDGSAYYNFNLTIS